MRSVDNGPVQWPIIVMKKSTIVLDVQDVSGKGSNKKSSFQDGKQQATRKNPRVIDVGLEPSMRHSYWYVTWMVT